MPRDARRRLPPIAWLPLVSQVIILMSLAGCLTGPPRPGSITGSARLDAFPTRLRTAAPAEVCWDTHSIPFILAGDDLDVPYLMGVTHAHLRLTQMEITRRLSQGRLSEMAGPPANRIDHTIRALALDRAVPEMVSTLPDETRRWIQRYVDGINDHRDLVAARPADYRLAGIGEEPWTIADVLTIGRLACMDINWGKWVSLLPLRDEPGWDDYMERLHAFSAAARPSFGSGEPTPLDPLLDAGRTGSNCVAVAPSRSATGSALLAGDPHLGLPQPNLWCIIGYRSPSHAAVGLTFPGLPFVLVGRNPHLAWGGTNMHALASVLYALPAEEPLVERSHRIRTRLFFDRTVTVRESALGPVISDAPLFREIADRPVALKWRGHEPSDESTAFLKASHAKTGEAFRAAFETFAAGSQNMLYADDQGNIGQVLAFEFHPAAGYAAAAPGPVDPEDPRMQWGPGIDSTRLPSAVNPAAGFLVSANNTPVLTDPPLVGQG
ncbi:MAG: penicillin acylase family protein, partial [Phycisphaerales bacterium]|nr:penicillin acylase family protein [Phycisphaerales bacterium]